jgi:hypothetical protein
MNAGAALGWYLDSRDRRTFVEALQNPELGFTRPKGDDATWLWRFSMAPLAGEVDAPCGSAVDLCALLGVPVVRLRAALPDELLSWTMANALGRRHVLSKTAMEEATGRVSK